MLMAMACKVYSEVFEKWFKKILTSFEVFTFFDFLKKLLTVDFLMKLCSAPTTSYLITNPQ